MRCFRDSTIDAAYWRRLFINLIENDPHSFYTRETKDRRAQQPILISLKLILRCKEITSIKLNLNIKKIKIKSLLVAL